jgi:hypothetical protein
VEFCFAVCAAAAQTPAPAGLVRGNLLEWDPAAGPKGSGELSIRTATHQVFRFSFDARTYFERDSQRTTIERIEEGDLLEIVSDRVPAGSIGYARTVHVIEEPAQPRRTLSAGRYRARRAASDSTGWYTADRSVLDSILPRGDLTFTGIVSRVDSARIVIRTRKDGEKTLMLVQDTRFLENGLRVPVSALKPNTRVFIRGTRNFENELEAYQVVWGEILEPGP